MNYDETALAMVGPAKSIRMAKLVRTINQEQHRTRVTNENAAPVRSYSGFLLWSLGVSCPVLSLAFGYALHEKNNLFVAGF